MRNQLADSPSPYLAMHGHDPVHWQQWGPEVFARARRENKLLYVSSGYFSCHWCHVMQRESYRNPAIAARLNRDFIPVKVDRELNPALDARLIDFVERTRGYAGWPLNVFITPKGYPLVGVVYLPPDHFSNLLDRLANRWQSQSAELRQLAKAATAELTAQPGAAPPADASDAPGALAQHAEPLKQALLKQAFSLADELQGGFGAENKFPSVPQLEALLTLYTHGHDERLGHFLRLSLDHMASGGLHDQLGGGFFRYTVDPAWQTPHFEKMLYDNALLARLYLRAGQVFAASDYTAIGQQTLDFMLATFGDGSQGMGASLSAIDAQGIEGGYYLWDKTDIRQRLDPASFRVVELAWGLDGAPTLEDGYHLSMVRSAAQVAEQLGWDLPRVQGLLAQARNTLRAARSQRRLPRDDKRLAAWNGLALSALIAGARYCPAPAQRTRYRSAAQRQRDFIVEHLWDGRVLKRALDPAQPRRGFGEAALEDYAYVAAGLLAWSELSGQTADRELAGQIARRAWQDFHTARGWRLDASELLRYGGGQPAIADGPMPSPSAVLIGTSLALGASLPRTTSEPSLEVRARRALHAGLATLADEPFWHATRILLLVDTTDQPGTAAKTGTGSPP